MNVDETPAAGRPGARPPSSDASREAPGSVPRSSRGPSRARRLLTAAALVPVLLGLAGLAWISSEGAHDLRRGAAFLMAATAAAFGAIIVFAALSLTRADRERTAAEAEHTRAARELQQAITTRDEFLSVASHELRTPLTALKLQLDSMHRQMSRSAGGIDPRFEKKVTTALRQADRMSHLIDGLLDVSRIAMGRFRLELSEFDLVTVVRAVCRRFQEEAEGGHTAVDLAAPASVLGRWDRLRLEQVLGNLLGNALKYGVGKPVHIRLEAAEDSVTLVVRDQGIGIAEQDLLRIFERFERAAPLRHYGGLGLGLYVTHQIAQAHGGTISVASIPGEGATFVVTLPRWTPPADPAASPADPARSSGAVPLKPYSDKDDPTDPRGSGVRATVGRLSRDEGPSAPLSPAALRRAAR